MTLLRDIHGTWQSYNTGCHCEACRAANTQRINRRRRERRPEDYDGPHGVAATYLNWNCRCEPCKAAHGEKQRAQQAARVLKGLPEGDRRHGTTNGYSAWGCRCEACRSAQSAHDKRRRTSVTVGTGHANESNQGDPK